MKTHSFSIVNQIFDYFNGFHAQNDIPKRQNYEQNRTEHKRAGQKLKKENEH